MFIRFTFYFVCFGLCFCYIFSIVNVLIISEKNSSSDASGINSGGVVTSSITIVVSIVYILNRFSIALSGCLWCPIFDSIFTVSVPSPIFLTSFWNAFCPFLVSCM